MESLSEVAFQSRSHYIEAMKAAARASGLRIHIADTYLSMSRRASDIVMTGLKRKPDLLLCAPAGGTPTGTYSQLASCYARRPTMFDHLRVLQIDEWQGLPRTDPATCASDLRKKLVRPLRISPARYIGFRSDAARPQAECGRISAWLAANGPIDICVLGIGSNGHVGMNEPAAYFIPHAHVAKLAKSSVQHPLLKDLARKPRYGLTLGLGEILRSRKILLLASGASKRAVLKRLLKPHVTTRFPASFLWLHPDATVLCDRDAAPDLL